MISLKGLDPGFTTLMTTFAGSIIAWPARRVSDGRPLYSQMPVPLST